MTTTGAFDQVTVEWSGKCMNKPYWRLQIRSINIQTTAVKVTVLISQHLGYRVNKQFSPYA
jgi:hypothetical protein